MKLRFLEDIKKSGSPCKEYDGLKYYVDTGNVKNDVIIGKEGYLYKDKPSRANITVEVGDILFAKMQNSVKVICIDETNKDYVYSTGFYCLKDDRVLPEYLKYYFLSKEFNIKKDNLCQGATMKALNDNGLKQIDIEVPSISEQKRIVGIVDSLYSIIKLKNEQLEKLDELVKARFVELFGTLDYPVQEFKKATLKDLCTKITDGKHGGCTQEEGTERYFVGAREIYDNAVHYDTAPEINLAEFEKDYKRCNVEIGDFLIVNTGATIGKSAIAIDPRTEYTLLQKSVALLKAKRELLNPVFLQYCYKVNEKMYKVESASAQPNLLLSKINSTEIYVPPIELQNQFAAFVEQTDKSKSVCEEKIKKYTELYDKLMNEYFGG